MGIVKKLSLMSLLWDTNFKTGLLQPPFGSMNSFWGKGKGESSSIYSLGQKTQLSVLGTLWGTIYTSTGVFRPWYYNNITALWCHHVYYNKLGFTRPFYMGQWMLLHSPCWHHPGPRHLSDSLNHIAHTGTTPMTYLRVQHLTEQVQMLNRGWLWCHYILYANITRWCDAYLL